MQSTATVVTDRPARYIKQLVSHLGHRLSTELADDGTAVITASGGEATLVPTDGAILATVVADEAASLAQVQDLVARHLVRFGNADELTVTWSA
jgi:hypothetical protein